MKEALYQRDLIGVTDRMENVLEQVTKKHYPAIGEIKDIMRKEGALNALMSGSGSTVFGIFKSKETAEKAAAACHEHPSVKQTHIVRPFNKSLRNH